MECSEKRLPCPEKWCVWDGKDWGSWVGLGSDVEFIPYSRMSQPDIDRSSRKHHELRVMRFLLNFNGIGKESASSISKMHMLASMYNQTPTNRLRGNGAYRRQV